MLPQDAISQLGNATFIWGRPIAPTPPTNGQALVWSLSNGRWQPGAGSGTGCTTAGAAGQALYDDGAGGCTSNANWTFTTTTLAPGASGILDLHLAATTAFKVPGGFTTGVLHVTTTTGATTGGLIVNADITNATIDLTAKVTGILPAANGGTANGFFAISGPATSTKTWTIPNSSINWTSLSGVTVLTSGVPSVVSGSGSDCVLVDGTSAPCGASGVGSAGNGLTLTSTTFSIDTTITMDLTTPQAVLGKKKFTKTGNIAALSCAESVAPVTTLTNGDWYCDSTLHVPEYYSNGVWVPLAINPMTAAGDIIISGASGVPARYALTTTGGFLYNNGTTRVDRIPLFSDLSGSAASAQIPAVPLTAGTSVTLTENNRYFVCTGTCTVTVPVPAAGVQYCVYNDDNVSTVITLAAIGSSSRYENTARTAYGTAGTGTFVSGGAVKDSVCIVGRDSTHYSTLSSNGTWTAN